jgi:hypothetical protein
MIVDHDRNETSDSVEFVILYFEIERLSIVAEQSCSVERGGVSLVIVERLVFEFCLTALFSHRLARTQSLAPA